MSKPEERVDALVRAYLDRQAERADPQAGLARIRQTLDQTPAPGATARRQVHRRWAWGLAAAAVLFVAVGAVFLVRPAQASAETLVREAQQAHLLPVDRCYAVDSKAEADGLETRLPFLGQPRSTRLWTRGDRFWIESTFAGRKWAWGRDDQGSIWLALTPKIGVRFEAREVPEPLALTCDLLSMKVETLLGDVLKDYDLQQEGPGLVRATLKPGRNSPLRSALLDIDPETKALKRLVLARAFRGRPAATVTFTLAETRPQEDARYQLEGHLQQPYQVFSKSAEPQRRFPLLIRHIGFKGDEGNPDRKSVV